MFGRYFLLLFVLYSIFKESLGAECSASTMNFQSRFSLGKQDQFNRTFIQIQSKIPSLQGVNYSAPNGANYSINNVKVLYRYLDSKQKAIFRGEDVIFIEGGYLQVDMTFDWKKTFMTPKNGSGAVSGLSDELTLGKKLVIDNKSYSYQLLDAFPFLMPAQKAFKLTRIDPPNTEQTDRQILLQMMNHIEGNKDVKTQLQHQIAKIYNDCINSSLHDEHFPLNLTFSYKWVPNHRSNLTVNFTRRPTSVDVQTFGIISTFDNQVENDHNWKCGTRKVPEMPLDPKVFGGIQQYISFDFYENVIKWAMDNQKINSDLDKYTWGNRMFQFYAGDLYQVFSDIQNKYYASQKVKGQCKGDSTGVSVSKRNSNSLTVILKYNCDLEIRNQQITKFSVDLKLAVQGHPKRDHINFKIVTHSQQTQFFPQGSYKLMNKELAELMIADSLNRLYEGNLFGSGWPQSPPKDYPHFRVEQNYTAVIDSAIEVQQFSLIS